MQTVVNFAYGRGGSVSKHKTRVNKKSAVNKGVNKGINKHLRINRHAESL